MWLIVFPLVKNISAERNSVKGETIHECQTGEVQHGLNFALRCPN